MTFKPFPFFFFFAIIILFPLLYTDIFSLFCLFQPPHQSNDNERTQSEDRAGDFMDSTMDFSNLLLLALPSSYASAATDGFSISGSVTNPSMVHAKTVEIGEVGTVIDPSPTPSSVATADIVEREIGVPPLVLEEVTDSGMTGGGATDPLLDLKELLVRPEKGLQVNPSRPHLTLILPGTEKPQVRLLLPMFQ